MSQGQGKDGERPAWSAQAEAVLAGLVDWQAVHPRATLAEIEAEVAGRLADLRVRLLEQAVCIAAQQTALDPGPTHQKEKAHGRITCIHRSLPQNGAQDGRSPPPRT